MYFPNGAALADFIEDWCEGCSNYRFDVETETNGCPLLDLHVVSATADLLVRENPLNYLIDEGVGCRMFLEADAERRDLREASKAAEKVAAYDRWFREPLPRPPFIEWQAGQRVSSGWARIGAWEG